MRVHVRTFATLRELSVDRCDLDLPEGADLEAAWAALAARRSGATPHRPYVRAARNGVYATWDEALPDGDEVAFMPPVSGGAAERPDRWGPRRPRRWSSRVARDGHGAVVTFIGRCARDHADDGRVVTELEYEAYPEMARGCP